MKIQVEVAKKREKVGRGGPTSRLHLNWAWLGIVANGIVMVFVKQVVVSIAQVLGAAVAKLRCALSATGFPLHPFLANDPEAADISHFDLFTGLEIGTEVWRCN